MRIGIADCSSGRKLQASFNQVQMRVLGVDSFLRKLSTCTAGASNRYYFTFGCSTAICIRPQFPYARCVHWRLRTRLDTVRLQVARYGAHAPSPTVAHASPHEPSNNRAALAHDKRSDDL